MFIDVTRLGADRSLRVAIAAIAYMDDTDDGTVLHLVGGQRLLISDTKNDVEARCQPILVDAVCLQSSLFSEADADMLATKLATAIAAHAHDEPMGPTAGRRGSRKP